MKKLSREAFKDGLQNKSEIDWYQDLPDCACPNLKPLLQRVMNEYYSIKYHNGNEILDKELVEEIEKVI